MPLAAFPIPGGFDQPEMIGLKREHNRRILVIDDNQAIHEDFRKVLVAEDNGDLSAQETLLFGKEVNAQTPYSFTVDSAYQGQAGLDCIKHSLKKKNPYALAFVDIRMPPGWDGIETVRRIWQLDPEIQIVLCTAFSDYSWEDILERLDTQDRLLFLKKPFDHTEVRQLAGSLTEKWNLMQEVQSRFTNLNQLVAEQTAELKNKNLRLQKELQALKRAEEREASLGKILDGTLNEIYIFDSESLRFIHANKSALKNLGYAMGELLSMTPADISVNRDREGMEKLVAPLRNGAANKLEFVGRNQRKDGSTYPLEIHLQRGDFGNRQVFVATALDIAPREQAEKERQELADQLRQAQKMEAIGQLAGGVAHDFNNMLQIISGYLELVQNDLSKDAGHREKLSHVLKAADRAKSLTRQLLAYSRRQVLHPANLNLNHLIQKLLDMLKRLIGDSIEIHFEPAGDLSSVKADAGQLEQAILNLCVNARDGMPEGGRLTLKTDHVSFTESFCKQHPWAKAGRFVRLTVSDTGVGISPEIMDKVFEPFFTTKGVGKGSGLGLSMVYGVFNQQGGMVDVSSELGKGASFKVYLPAVDEKVASKLSAERKEKAPKGRETVLLAEDDRMVRRFVTEVLELAGYQVIAAHDGEQAVELYRTHAAQTNLVIMDVMMPKLNGLKAQEMIQNIDPQVRTILASGYSSETIDPSILENPRTHFIQKPFDLGSLLREVREILDLETEGGHAP